MSETAMNPTWSLQELTELLRNDDEEVAVWATDRIPLQAEREELARWLAPALEESTRGRVQRAALFELRERGGAHEADLPVLRAFLARTEGVDAEARLEALALVSRYDEAAAGELAQALREDRTPVAQGIWTVWSAVAPQACRRALDEVLPESFEADRVEAFEARFAVASPQDAEQLIDWLAEVEDEEVADLLGEALLERIAGSRFLQDFERPVDTLVRTMEAGLPGKTWADLAGRMRTRLFRVQGLVGEDEEDQAMAAVLEWLREDLAEADASMPLRAWFEGLIAALSGYQEDTDPWLVQLATALLLSLGWTAGLYGSLSNRKGQLEKLLVGWIASGGAVAEVLEGRVREAWAQADAETRARAIDALAAIAHEGGLREVDTRRLVVLGQLEGFDRGRLARSWVNALVAREDEVAAQENVIVISAPEASMSRLVALEPAVLRELAAELLPRGRAARVLLDALALQSEPWAAALVVEHMEALRASSNEQDLWPALRDLGDPAVLDRLVELWRAGEWEIAQAVARLAKIADRVEELPEGLLEDAGRASAWQKMLSEREDADQTHAPRPLRVRVRCEACGTVSSHNVPVALFAPAQLRAQLKEHIPAGWDGFMLNRVIDCRYCDATDRFAVVPTSRAEIVKMATVAAEAGRKFTNAPEEVGAFVALSRLGDGTVVTRASQLLERLRQQAEANATRAEGWRMYGNAAHRFGRDTDAVEAWVRAVELDPRELEAAFAVAMWLLRETGPEEAAEAVLEAVRRVPRARGLTNDELRGHIARQCIAALAHVREKLPPEMLVVTTWSVKPQVKPGQPVPQQPVTGTASSRLAPIKRWDILIGMLLSKDLAAIDFTTDPAEAPSGSNEVSAATGQGAAPVQLEALLAGEVDVQLAAGAQGQAASAAARSRTAKKRKKNKR